MFDELSFAEVDGQRAELLPARTVMSLFSTSGGTTNNASAGCGSNSKSGILPIDVIGNILNGNQILSQCTVQAG